MAEPRNYKGKDLAPYQRFRPTRFYDGSYTADVMYCNWTCNNCWSKFGWRTVEPKFELTSDQVVSKLVGGMRRNSMAVSRITGGEPSIYWNDHMQYVAQKFLLQTAGETVKVAGVRKKQPMVLILETNGTAMTPAGIDAVEAAAGDEAWRLHITVGVKASSTPRLSSLTGHTIKTAQRFRGKQMELIEHLAQPDRIVDFTTLFLDAFTEEEELERYKAMLRSINPELDPEDVVDMEQFRTGGWGSQKLTQANYTPKRDREAEDGN